MTIETTIPGTLVIIVVMALVTLITRFAGPFLMSFVTINPRIEGFITTMASSVLIAILVPLAIEGDAGARLALLSTSVMMLIVRRPLPSISVGIIVAALTRHLI